MSRVHLDPGLIPTIREEESGSLTSDSLEQHEEHNLLMPRHQRRRRGTIDALSSDKSSDVNEQRRARRMSKRAFDVTRRLSVSTAMFSQLHGLFAKEGGAGGGGGGGGEVSYENTYRLEPKHDERFLPGEVSAIAQGALRQKLEGATYEPKASARLCCSLANIIRSRIHENLDLPRYKLIVNVIVGERRRQSLQVASRCLWNQATDRCASATYQNETLFAVATIHGIYFD